MKSEDWVIQVFSLVVCLLLAVIFVILLITGTGNLQNVITPLILIIIAVIGLSILWMMTKLERFLSGKLK